MLAEVNTITSAKGADIYTLVASIGNMLEKLANSTLKPSRFEDIYKVNHPRDYCKCAAREAQEEHKAPRCENMRSLMLTSSKQDQWSIVGILHDIEPTKKLCQECKSYSQGCNTLPEYNEESCAYKHTCGMSKVSVYMHFADCELMAAILAYNEFARADIDLYNSSGIWLKELHANSVALLALSPELPKQINVLAECGYGVACKFIIAKHPQGIARTALEHLFKHSCDTLEANLKVASVHYDPKTIKKLLERVI